MTFFSKKSYLYIGLTGFLLFSASSSYADCPDKTVPCTAIDEDGHEVLLGYQIVNYKGTKVKNAKSFFTGLSSGFKCYPCVEGCGKTVAQAILQCNEKAKNAGYKAGYISKKSLEGVSLGSVVDKILDRAEKAAKIGGDVAMAVK